ncbi:MAG: transglutaminase-like domain-containing protein [Clostridiales Family XIII bacterium]|jgi:transglutaminase-like putative cysteine protease|nr:transglutaminase-like domain-containing protein [Clostridiales Family XIII bacterium]
MRFLHRENANKLILCCILIFFLVGCSGGAPSLAKIKDAISGSALTVKEDPNAPLRDNTPRIAYNDAPGAAVFQGGGATVDYSNAWAGYVMISYGGDNPKIKIQITLVGGGTYTYDLPPNTGYQAFPLSQGAGAYDIAVFTNIEGDKYAQAARGTIDAPISDPLSPFLHPNIFSNFSDASACVSMASQIVAEAKTDLGATERIFQYIVKNISYDYDKAATVQSGYIPNPDATLQSMSGICFDYASLMSSMLRSQGIPCQLIVGYAGQAYHAWVAVYSSQSGELLGTIEFSADNWNLADPTFAASGDRADPNIIGDGTNYNPMYYY